MDLQHRNAFFYATVVALGGFLFGLDAALIAGTVDYLTQEFSLTALQLGNVVSAPALGVLAALPFVGFICNRFGRKKTVMLVAILYLVSAMGSAFAPSFEILWGARFLGGLAFSSIALASMYIGEVAPREWRGKLVSMTQINIVVGLSGAYFVNYLINHWAGLEAGWVASLGIDQHTWRWMLGSEIPFALLWFFLLISIPESPSWLMYRNRPDDAERTLQKILPEKDIAHHMKEMRESLRKNPQSHGIGSQLKVIFGKRMRLIFIIALTIAIAQQSTGINAILFYAQTVFKQLGGGTDAAFSQALWIGLVSLVSTIIGLLLVDKIGRRPMIIGGMVWIVISHGWCSYEFKQARYTLTSEDIAELQYIPNPERLEPLTGLEFENDVAFKKALREALGDAEALEHQGALLQKAITMNAAFVLIGILSFISAFQMTVGPVMWVLFSEIFPISVRGLAIPFFTIVTSLTNYVVQQFFPWQLENMGMSTIFLSYAVVVSVGLIILFFTLKETKGLSIEEIQKKLARS